MRDTYIERARYLGSLADHGIPIYGPQYENLFVEVHTGYYPATGKADGVGVQCEETMSCMLLSHLQILRVGIAS